MSRGSSVSDKEEHLKLASVVKGVHAKLRRELQESNGDFDKVWNEHCSNQDLLTEYAEAMHHLAVDHWSKNPETRIHWCRRTCLEYFLEGGLKRALDKEERQRLFNRQFSHRDSMSSQTSDDCEVSTSNVIVTDGQVTHTLFVKHPETASDVELSTALSNLQLFGQESAQTTDTYLLEESSYCVSCQRAKDNIDQLDLSHTDLNTKTVQEFSDTDKKVYPVQCRQCNTKVETMTSKTSDMMKLDSEKLQQRSGNTEAETTAQSPPARRRKLPDSFPTDILQATHILQPWQLPPEPTSTEKSPVLPAEETPTEAEQFPSAMRLTDTAHMADSSTKQHSEPPSCEPQPDISTRDQPEPPICIPHLNSPAKEHSEPPTQSLPLNSPTKEQPEPPFRGPADLYDNNNYSVSPSSEVQSLPSVGSQSLGGLSSSSGMDSDGFFVPSDQEAWRSKQHQLSKGNYTSVTLPFRGRIRLLDVGSCFNPFREFEEFLALGIDISPAVESVYHCDFLHLELSEPLQLAVDTMDSYLQSVKDPIERLPAECFHVVVFSLLLEYFPSAYQRWLCCQKAQQLLMINGLLLVITPDSGHQNRNAPMMKSWKKAIESLGYKRWKYVKQEHLHCMAFRKIHRSSTESYLVGDVTPDMMYIPQDFHEIKIQSKNFGISFSDNTLEDYNCIRETFNEMPLAEESEEEEEEDLC
ncbi:uncharacterized protein LOC106162450 [Lingula anatina]|uniref:S-adenosylmethionine sensor upstream of mTORC1 n=1 Tax=Lingula anatina TaxID=7574 RepID=A0A1S3IAB3_LINAN|nr:uncharacterized protein LOC106162450 [Lingula anatina]|eukprot:XP_013395205.1 uncharacterized protein LOC106162450 [Lingula anatina]